MNNNYWNLKPHTRIKLEIYNQYLQSFLTIFKNQRLLHQDKDNWCQNICIVDCFAGRGYYNDDEGSVIDGSPLIAVKLAKKFQDIFKTKSSKKFSIKCFFIEEDKKTFIKLKSALCPYEKEVSFNLINGDFNKEIVNILKDIGNYPTLFFIDPCGIKQLKKESVQLIVNKRGPKDFFLNYINEGVVRVKGVAKKCVYCKNKPTEKEIKTSKNLEDFIGEENKKIVGKKDFEILKYYVDTVLKNNQDNPKEQLEVLAYDMPYPNKKDTIYYILFVSKNKNAVKIVRDIYAAHKQDFNNQLSFFDKKKQKDLSKGFNV